MFEPFDPAKHKGAQLFEIVSVEREGAIETTYEASDVPFDVAKDAPWYYVVERAAED